MSLYWPAFEFNFTLDMARLLPHMAAIEASKAAASSEIETSFIRLLLLG